jgi:signal transduction histidine kinase
MPPNKPVIIYTLTLGIFIMISFLVLLFLGITAYIKKRSIHQAQMAKLQADFASTLLQSQLEIREQTLQHVGRELHDNLGHMASLIKINLTTLNLANPDTAAEKVEATKELTRQLLTDLKALSRSIGPDRISRLGLVKAIEQEVANINKTGEFRADYQTDGIIPSLPDDKLIILFRMIQEILQNMVRHSQAKNISLILIGTEKSLNLKLSDDGTGFNVEEKLQGEGAGLHNLINRAKLISAEFSIQSSLSKGTQITINLPT